MRECGSAAAHEVDQLEGVAVLNSYLSVMWAAEDGSVSLHDYQGRVQAELFQELFDGDFTRKVPDVSIHADLYLAIH